MIYTGEEWRATLHYSSPTLHPENLCKSVESVGHKKKWFQPPTEQGELPFQFRAQSEGEEW